MQKVLVTGVSGFVGKHLVRELVNNSIVVSGIGMEESPNKEISSLLKNYYACDLTKPDDVAKIKLDGLTAIINLAGFAAVGVSFDRAEEYMRVNTAVLTTLCDRLLNEELPVRMIAVSTGAVYASSQPMPLTENSKTDKSSSPYTASKLAMEAEVSNYRNKGVDCVIVRPFNHIGPGQAPGFLLPDLHKKISELPSSTNDVKVGNLETKRDYTDVRDVVRAYRGLATSEKLSFDTYNVCSGKPIAGTEILDKLLTNMHKQDIKPVVDKSLFRPSDAPVLYGDNSRLAQDINWKPEFNLDQTIKDFVANF